MLKGMDYLMDTSALLSHFRREPGWDEVHRIFQDASADIYLASPSLPEMGRRLRDLDVPESEVVDVLESYAQMMTEIVAVDARIAHLALVISWRTPTRLPLVDALIAACAQAKGATLIHRDEHMRGIPFAKMIGA
jgi:predicted nucleic acid-binding protein